MDWAFENIKIEQNTRIDMKCCLRFMRPAIIALNYDSVPVGQIGKKHVKLLLEKTGKMKVLTDIPIGKTGRTKKGTWSANQFNHYRTYLGMLFNTLESVDAVVFNPALKVAKEDHTEAIRDTLTDEQRVIINKNLHDNYYSFWRFLHMFFHSGARIIELLRVKEPDVELRNQRFKVLVKKGKKTREEWRTIKTIALPFWKELMAMAKPGQFLFSTSLLPGDVMIRREQISKRWRVHVKEKLNVTADFYSLKHSNLDEVAEQLSLAEAQKAAGHSTPVITMKYAKGESGRKHNKLKEVANVFAK